jgi:hypothetical protein
MSDAFNVAAILDDFERVTVSVDLRGAVSVDALGQTTRATTTISSSAVWHPVSDRELQRMPEADRRRGMRRYYTEDEWPPGSVVTHDGEQYVVTQTKDYEDHGGLHIMMVGLVDRVAS